MSRKRRKGAKWQSFQTQDYNIQGEKIYYSSNYCLIKYLSRSW